MRKCAINTSCLTDIAFALKDAQHLCIYMVVQKNQEHKGYLLCRSIFDGGLWTENSLIC